MKKEMPILERRVVIVLACIAAIMVFVCSHFGFVKIDAFGLNLSFTLREMAKEISMSTTGSIMGWFDLVIPLAFLILALAKCGYPLIVSGVLAIIADIIMYSKTLKELEEYSKMCHRGLGFGLCLIGGLMAIVAGVIIVIAKTKK